MKVNAPIESPNIREFQRFCSSLFRKQNQPEARKDKDSTISHIPAA